MTTVETPVAAEHIDPAGGEQPANPIPSKTPVYAQCASYKEAKYLAARRRRDGEHAYAVYVIALDRWCVRESTALQRYG
jgi:hypothetical protein